MASGNVLVQDFKMEEGKAQWDGWPAQVPSVNVSRLSLGFADSRQVLFLPIVLPVLVDII